MLGIAGRAAVAAGEHLALVEQRIDHDQAGLLDVRCQDVHCLLLGIDAGLEQPANSGLHVHLVTLSGAVAFATRNNDQPAKHRAKKSEWVQHSKAFFSH
ncbi:hypothetical protein D3C71_1729780 [compost metagenome]